MSLKYKHHSNNYITRKLC